jgi:hypothetical protein
MYRYIYFTKLKQHMFKNKEGQNSSFKMHRYIYYSFCVRAPNSSFKAERSSEWTECKEDKVSRLAESQERKSMSGTNL